MNREAYLHLRVSKRSGRVRYAQVMSDRAPTEVDPSGVWVCLVSATGCDYDDAERRLLKQVRTFHPWVMRFVRNSRPLVRWAYRERRP